MNNTEHSIGRWISILYRFGQSYLGKRLEHLNIGSGQYVVLMTLFRNNGIRQEKLSDYLKIDKGSIAKSIKKLEAAGYVTRRIDAGDKRANQVFITPKALDAIPEVREAARAWEDMIVSEFSEEEKQVIERLLHKMAAKAYNIKEPDKEKDSE